MPQQKRTKKMRIKPKQTDPGKASQPTPDYEISPKLKAEIDKIAEDMRNVIKAAPEAPNNFFNKHLSQIDLSDTMDAIGKLFEGIINLYYDSGLNTYRLDGAKLYIQEAWKNLLKQDAHKNRVKRPDGFDILHLASARINLIESIIKHTQKANLNYSLYQSPGELPKKESGTSTGLKINRAGGHQPDPLPPGTIGSPPQNP